MFVSKKKYEEALLKINNLEQLITVNNEHLKTKDDTLVDLTKEYDSLIKIYNETKSELEKIITSTNTLNELQSQERIVESKISHKKSILLSLNTKITTIETELQSKTNHLLQLGIDINKYEVQNLLLQNTNIDLQNERNTKILEVENLDKEIEKISNDKYLKASSLERQLLQELSGEIEIQKEEISQNNIKLEQIEKNLRNKDAVLQEYIKVKKSLILARDEKTLQEMAFYKNVFPFTTTEQFKDQLTQNNQRQKEMIKNKFAVKEGTTWTVNGSAREGRRMTDLNIKAMIRSYNVECDNAITSLKYSNYESVVSRLDKSLADINKLNQKNELSINEKFHKLKLRELSLMYELKLFEQNEKEKMRILREEERERKKVEQEIKEKLLELSTHEKQIVKELNLLDREFTKSKGENVELLNKIKELEDSLSLVYKKREEVNQRHLIGKSGYVYIISNIGTLGENVYKIGMTRRLEPLDRIKELSGASVPFEYDVHAMILTDDAPRLENHLHSVFNSNRVNLVNNRKEFFNIDLDEIKKEVFSIIGKDVIFLELPQASQFYQTLAAKSAFVNTEKEDIFFVH